MRHTALLAACCVAVAHGAAMSAPLTPEEIESGAAARIEECRKGDAVVRVVDANGGAIVDASVKAAQTRHAFLFGCNFFGFNQPSEEEAARYRGAFADVLNYATLPFYWGSFEGKRGVPDYAGLDAMADWCVEHNITPKGHPLVWNMVPPRWLTAEDSVQHIKELSDARVRDIVQHFAGRIDVWDVVNEATDPFRFQNPVTEAWRFFGQVPFTTASFEVARTAVPEALLLINDYRTDDAYAKVIEQLVTPQAEGEPQRLYDAIGIQSHQHGGVWSPETIWQVCERFAAFGVPLHFTETTILSGPRNGDKWAPTTPALEEQQAEQTARFYTILFSHPAVEAITWWDFADRYAWQGAAAGWLREDLSGKPVYDRMKQLIKGDWWTTAEGRTGDDGTFPFRGFYGDYTITVTVPDGREIPAQTTLIRGVENVFLVNVG